MLRAGRLVFALLGLILSIALTALAAGPSSAADTATAAAVRSGSETPYEYRLGSADRVRITTFGEAALSGEFVVSGSGIIALPLLQENIQAAGLTTTELARVIESKLKDGYLKDPRVSVEVLNYRPFYILGEVMKPGEYPYTNGLTVMNAVATANGFTYRADTRRVLIKRANGDKEQEFPLTAMTEVQPGDTIRVRERHF